MRDVVPGTRGSGGQVVAGRPEVPTAGTRAHPPLLSENQWQRLARSHALAKRERDVLQLVTRGLRIRDAADVLGLRPETVRGYLRSAYKKLRCRGKTDLILRLVHEYWTPAVMGRIQERASGG